MCLSRPALQFYLGELSRKGPSARVPMERRSFLPAGRGKNWQGSTALPEQLISDREDAVSHSARGHYAVWKEIPIPRWTGSKSC